MTPILAAFVLASVAAVELEEVFHLDNNIKPTPGGGWKCVDRVNPTTGKSVCAGFTQEHLNKLCTTRTMDEWMFINCPTKCPGFCPDTAKVRADDTCQDLVNPFTGETLCSKNNKILCRILEYAPSMFERCPKTCGICKSPTESP